jgi:hypothetical protein
VCVCGCIVFVDDSGGGVDSGTEARVFVRVVRTR